MSLFAAETVEEVKRLMELGHDVNSTNCKGKSVLHYACKKGNLDIVKVLCEAGANVNKRDFRDLLLTIDDATKAGYLEIVKYFIGNCPAVKLDNALYYACKKGNLDIVKVLCKAGIDVNYVSSNCESALYYACVADNLDIVKVLCEAGANINCKTSWGKSVLHCACENGNLDIVKMLCEAGACVNEQDSSKYYPIYCAVENDNLEIVKYLIENHPVKLDRVLYCASTKGNIDVLRYLLTLNLELAKPVLDLNSDDYYNPLHHACNKGNLDIVKMLCEAGADVNKKYVNDYPIDNAASYGNLNIVKYLIENHPVKLDHVLYFASLKGHTDIFDYLLTLNLELAKPIFDLNSNDCYNPLLAACQTGKEDIVDRLLNAGVDINIMDTKGFTPLTVINKNNLNIIKKLVMRGADYHSYGGESLLISCECSYDDISEFLIELGCDVNCCIDNMTPLMHACKNNNLKNSLKVLKLLLERGANPDFVAENGKKAVDYCTSDEVRALFN